MCAVKKSTGEEYAPKQKELHFCYRTSCLHYCFLYDHKPLRRLLLENSSSSSGGLEPEY
ncbi:hypothetical protein M404DRAFT_992190 [Pisolithus tinctorius Marx 270]|uniref:Uncharacterized protein n=1 Tax=Pisolithus tinctorius Marx 270 TaxID=870435 RepID=A0A0C3PXY3_PISTI|nr:hypothetical protein M404DRAFT_992190 [Pisolithus tinctorius Marx 270]